VQTFDLYEDQLDFVVTEFMVNITLTIPDSGFVVNSPPFFVEAPKMINMTDEF